ncbi:MAG: hypothetical protein JWO38_754 [Gemmataceae bacterium]|nr:hypothetical protein [Gemmataceae bacterium]
MSFLLNPIPVVDVFDEGYVDCDACGERLTDECVPDGCGGFFCVPCLKELLKEWEVEARQYAAENCRITRALPEYDPDLEFRPSPEDYAAGDREAYTPNAHMAKCRHEFTNYDELIRNLDRDSMEDQVAYEAIVTRINALLIEAEPV